MVERILVAYVVRQPPALDSKLTDNCVKMLQYAPLFLLFNGYWMLSNHQIFKNSWHWVETNIEQMKSDHHMEFLAAPWATPLLMMGFFAIFLLVLKRVFKDYLQEWGFAMNRKDIDVDEGLPNFFESVKLTASEELC